MTDLKRFDLNLLVLFEALWEQRSVSAAARRLHLGQPAASAALARLRESVGDELFIRAGGAMRPTPRAIELASSFSHALAEVRSALGRSARFEPQRSNATFTVAHTDYTALVTLPLVLRSVRAAAPAVNLRVVGYDKEEVFGWLDRMEINLAVGVFPAPPPRTKSGLLYEDSFIGVACSDHPVFQRRKITVESYVKHPHALVTVRRDATGYIDQRLAELGHARRVSMTTPYMFALGAALPGTDLIATLPRRAADRLPQRGLRFFELPFATEPWSVSMVWSPIADADPAQIWLRDMVAGSVATSLKP